MNHRLLRPVLFLGCVSLLLLIGLFLPGKGDRQKPHTFALVSPGFVQTAHAEGDATLAGVLDEAGIAGYYKTDGTITIGQSLRNVFRTIEDEKPTYIVGSIPVPSFPESYDVHAFVHTDGWIMLYYLKADPVGKIFDWNVYTAGAPTIVTVFETVAPIVAGAAGKPYSSLSYYDFRYPNANQMTLIAEDNNDEDDFTVQLPSSFTYAEFSWSIGNKSCGWRLNNVGVGSSGVFLYAAGLISPGQMAPNSNHIINVDSYYYCEGGLALIYEVP